MSSTPVCRHIPHRRASPIVACATVLALAGCAGLSMEDAVPSGARSQSTAAVVGTGPSAPRQTGEFPNLNIVPKPATEQFTDAESSATTSELLQAQARARRTVASFDSPGEGERLRVLGNTHGAKAIVEIEAR